MQNATRELDNVDHIEVLVASSWIFFEFHGIIGLSRLFMGLPDEMRQLIELRDQNWVRSIHFGEWYFRNLFFSLSSSRSLQLLYIPFIYRSLFLAFLSIHFR